jgi:hypothetical protein
MLKAINSNTIIGIIKIAFKILSMWIIIIIIIMIMMMISLMIRYL